MTLGDITPLILTFNEAENIGRTLARLAWASRVVVVDSLSTDDTLTICRRYANAEVVQRPFDEHASQWNFGLSLIRTPWVLTLDADYALPEAFVDEVTRLDERGVDGFFAKFTYCVTGRPLRGSIYPPRLVLFLRDRGTYVQEGHTQLLKLEGRAGQLRTSILHDDRKALTRWMHDQIRYAASESKYLQAAPRSSLNLPDRIRRMVIVAPLLMPLYTLVGRGLLLDGWPGVQYALQRTCAEILLALHMLDRRLRPSHS